MTSEKDSIQRIRTAASWLKRTGKHIEAYPRVGAMTTQEQFEAKQFACGSFPWPAKWTTRLYKLAKAD